MVGGASRVPLVKSLLYNALGVQPRTELDPKTVVALGGLRWMAMKASDKQHEAALPAELTDPPDSSDQVPDQVGGRMASDHPEWEEGRDSVRPGRSGAGTVAAILLGSAAVIGLISLLPQFSSGGVPRSSEASRTFLSVGVFATWAVGMALLRSRQAAVLLVGAFFIGGITLPQLGSPLTELGSASPHLGFWLMMASLLLALAGVFWGFVAVDRIRLLGGPSDWRENLGTTHTRFATIGILALTALLAITFLLPWAGSSTISRTFDTSAISSLGTSWTALCLVLIPVAALLWRPALAGMALITGLLVSQALVVVASAIFHAGDVWMYLHVFVLLGLALLFTALARFRRVEVTEAHVRAVRSQGISNAS